MKGVNGMSKRMEGKVAVVTGGASGIGLAVVERFVEEGGSVVLCDLTPNSGKTANDQVGGQLHHARREDGGENDGYAIARRLGKNALFVPADVTKEPELRQVFDAAKSEFGGLDVLVNNAGIGTTEGQLTDVPESVFERTMDVNLKGAWYGMRLAIPLLMQRGGGSVVNLSSILGLRGWPNQSTYAATKGALLAMSRAAALEVAPSKIRINCVCPGIMLTPIYYDSPAAVAVDREKLAAHFATCQPIPRAGIPKDVANTILFLASDESSFITGQALVVDGGLDAHVFSNVTYDGFMGGLMTLMAGAG
jgi:NAD(P)-dependent dehydrogenase (short-subunit alcohol dehydrogenase family)